MKLTALLVAFATAWSPALVAAPPELNIDQQQFVNSHGFLSAHPDLRWRREGLVAYEDGHYKAAAGYFRNAARYADKASQAMYAEMLWEGNGVPRDHALAYVWMDLAAERGYQWFLIKREYYWQQLSDAQRERALSVGHALYVEYGDAAAKPRLEAQLRRAKRNLTGSRIGFVGDLDIVIPGVGFSRTTDGFGYAIKGETYYDDRFWKPEQYWQWQDRVWGESREGRVEVLPIEVVEDPENEG